MNKSELNFILQEGEGQFVEFKEQFDKNLAKEMAAFSNASGGRIFLGIDDKGNIKGIDNSYETRVLNEPLNDKEKIVLNYIKSNPGCDRNKVVNGINYSLSSVKRYLTKLISLKLIKYAGSDKTGGYWMVKPK